MKDEILFEIFKAASRGAIANFLGISRPAVSQWKRVPSQHVIALEKFTGISRSDMRPDIYPSHDCDKNEQ